MIDLGDRRAGVTLRFPFNTNAIAGESITVATDGTVRVYKDGNTTQTTTGATFSENFDNVTGTHLAVIDTSADGTFYSEGSDFLVMFEGATIDGKAINAWVGSFSLANRAGLMPTTAGRKLDVSAGGEAGVDWANVGSPTTTLNLSGTTVKTATDVETDTADIQSRLPAALVSGRMSADAVAISGSTTAADNVEANIGNLDAAVSSRSTVTTAQVNSEVDTALSDIGLDHLVSASVAGADVADNSIIAKLASKSATADWDSYNNTTDSHEALRDRGDAAWTTGEGGGDSAWTEEEKDDVIAILNSISTEDVTFTSPVLTSDTASIERGDGYYTADSRSLSWTLSGHPSLSGATVVFIGLGLTKAVSVSGSTVTLELTEAQTAAMPPGVHPFEIQATLSNSHVVTLLRGRMTVRETL